MQDKVILMKQGAITVSTIMVFFNVLKAITSMSPLASFEKQFQSNLLVHFSTYFSVTGFGESNVCEFYRSVRFYSGGEDRR